MAETQKNATCLRCSCLCDDLQVTVQSNRVTAVENACRLGADWWLQQTAESTANITIEGKPASQIDATTRAAVILSRSAAPLITGFGYSSTAGQRAACRLADRLGAAIDPLGSKSMLAPLIAMQQVGQSTATLGEIRHRADLVLLWGCDPVTTHPRFFERFVTPAGMFVPEGRAGRRIVFCGAQRNATAELADEIVENAPDGDLDLISALRLAVEEKPLRADSYGGVERAKIVNLANQLRRSSYVAVLFGEEWMRGDASHVALASLFRLVRELNAHTRCVVRGLGGGGNLAGAQNVLAWQTGFAAAVSFSQGYPRYLPNEFTAHTLLTRGEVDSVLIVGNDVACLSAENLTRLAGLPTIVLGPTAGALPFSPTVFIPTAIDGVHRAGIAYRLDDVPVPLKQVLESSLSSEAEVLAEIEKIILEEKCV